MSDDAITADLYGLLSPEALEHPHFGCSKNYALWEANVATPELMAKGYAVSHWRSIEEDSFGPLIRAVDLTRDGKTVSYFYG